ncbi:MAG: O-antigen ligase family protein [Brockia lithotrophica]|nr:O-antigen ligase family protein [Brockia lithotrophica]
MIEVIMLMVLLFTIFVGLRYPLIAVAIASQSYVIRNAFIGTYYFAIEDNPQEGIWGILFPLAAYLVLLLNMSRNKDLKIPKLVTSDIIMIVLTIILLAGVIYSPDPYRGLIIFAKFVSLALVYYLLLRLYLSNYSSTHNFYTYFIGLWIISVLVSIFALTFQTGIDKRLTVGSSHPIPFGMLIASGLLINVFFIVNSNMINRYIPKKVLFASALILLYAFIASNNRGPFIAWVISTIFLIAIPVLRSKFVFLKFKYVINLMLVALVIFIAFIFIKVETPFFIERLFNGLSMLLSSGEGKGQSALERINAWETALGLFSLHPILGVGTGGFAYFHFFEYPHNIILEVAAENGAFGIITLIFLIIISLREIMLSTRKQSNPFSVLAASLTLLNLIESQVSYTLWMHKGWFISLAFLIALNRAHDDISTKFVSFRR